MMQSIKEIADSLGVSKQKVYRYIRNNHIIEALQDGQVKRYDDAVVEQIKRAFEENEPHHEAVSDAVGDAVNDAVDAAGDVVDAVGELVKELRQRIADKDKQIEFLEDALRTSQDALVKEQESLKAEQTLHAATIQKLQLLQGDAQEEPQAAEDKKRWWQFWK